MDTHELIQEIWQIDGMTCVNCQNKLSHALGRAPGVHRVSVSYNEATAEVSYDPKATDAATLAGIIEQTGYKVVDAEEKSSAVPDLIGLLLVIVALFLMVQHFGLTRFFSSVPLASESMSYAALFVVGLVTSLHCIAMCGGLQLSLAVSPFAQKEAVPVRNTQATGRFQTLVPTLLYNGGRLISYTLLGALVGALGGVISFNGTAKGIVQIFAGIFMLIMGLNMLGVAPAFLRRLTPRLPAFLTKGLRNTTTGTSRSVAYGPFVVGLLNGLMPCGPLQAMQLYALSTGSPLVGAFSMFVFCLGTIPLMFGLGTLSSLLSQKFTRTVLQFGSVIVAVFGLVMLTTGLALSGVRLPSALAGTTLSDAGGAALARVEGDTQRVTTTLASGQYQAITVQVGIPVRWTVTATDADINGCNNTIIIPAYDIEYEFHPGDNLIEFTPTKPGIYPYTCWMGMISSTITVLDENGQEVKGTSDDSEAFAATNPTAGAGAAAACPCCSGAAPQ
jgi:sulfite exporter TauE/SafE/copper chaperone CopZ